MSISEAAGKDLWTTWFCLVLHLLGCAKMEEPQKQAQMPKLYMCAPCRSARRRARERYPPLASVVHVCVQLL